MVKSDAIFLIILVIEPLEILFEVLADNSAPGTGQQVLQQVIPLLGRVSPRLGLLPYSSNLFLEVRLVLLQLVSDYELPGELELVTVAVDVLPTQHVIGQRMKILDPALHLLPQKEAQV